MGELRLLRDEGIRFRRQHVHGNYIVDFACPALKLVIELDGTDHTEKIRQRLDAHRDAWLGSQGYTVIRYTNHDILTDIANVMDNLMTIIASRSPF